MTRTTFARAVAGYDKEFTTTLTNSVARTIAEASLIADANVVAYRTAETVDALMAALVAILAMSDAAATPAGLRHVAKDIARRIRDGVPGARGATRQLLAARPEEMNVQ